MIIKKNVENHKILRIYKSPHNLLQHTESMSLTFFQIPHNLEFFINLEARKGHDWKIYELNFDLENCGK